MKGRQKGDAPLQKGIIEALKRSPHGLSVDALASRLGSNANSIKVTVSKMRKAGQPIKGGRLGKRKGSIRGARGDQHEPYIWGGSYD